MSTTPSPALLIDRVTHRYDDHQALNEVSFTVPEGTLYGLLGPNGSGKTTLFRIITTLLVPSSGRALVFGQNTQTAPAAVRRSMSMIFQQPALDDQLTVTENIRLHGALYGLSQKTLKNRIPTVLEQLGIVQRANDRVEGLSGGLRRRTDLARGLLHEPRLLLLDEPTSGLDPRARRELWERLRIVQNESKMTILVATHLMEEAERCDELAIVNNGNLAVTGTPHNLRSELGTETLWLETEQPQQLKDSIEAKFGFQTQIIGRSVQVQHPNAPDILSTLYEALGDHISSATVRQPTLEDVFMSYTGREFSETSADSLTSVL